MREVGNFIYHLVSQMAKGSSKILTNRLRDDIELYRDNFLQREISVECVE